MTATTAPVTVVQAASAAERRAHRSARIRGIILCVLGLIAFGLASNTMASTVTFKFWVQEQGQASVQLQISVGVLWLLTGIATGVSGIWQLWKGPAVRWRRWLILTLPFWVAAVMGTMLAGQVAVLTNLFAGTLEYAFPISMGAFAAIIAERSGMFDIAVEGKLLVGACVASISASMCLVVLGPDLGQVVGPIVGPAVAAISGVGIGLLMAWLAINYQVDQIITGTVVNFGALGLTNFVYLRVLQTYTEYNTPPTIEKINIPVLSDVPVLGPIFFQATPYVYIGWGVMLVLTYFIFRTRWGLRLRSSGEYPQAAATVGIDVIRIRYRAMLLAGAIAGFAGSYLSLHSAGSFQMNMSAGKGWIAIAAMIFGAWNPIGAFGAALVFGFADASQQLLSTLGVDVPPQFLASVPYILTIVVVAGFVGRVRGPAMAGQPYEQG
jgi:general nucleoside transport system permease protein